MVSRENTPNERTCWLRHSSMTARPQRHSLLHAHYDYSQSGPYFITIVTQHRLSLLGEVDDGEVQLTATGEMVRQHWFALPERFPGVALDEFIVMPNHVHAVLSITDESDPVGAPLVGARPLSDRDNRTSKITLGTVVGAFKSLTTVAYAKGVREYRWRPFNKRLWQRNYYEHVVRDERSLDLIRSYIQANPSMWETDPENFGTGDGLKPGLREPWMV